MKRPAAFVFFVSLATTALVLVVLRCVHHPHDVASSDIVRDPDPAASSPALVEPQSGEQGEPGLAPREPDGDVASGPDSNVPVGSLGESETLFERASLHSPDGRFTRTRIVRSDFKYPLVRIVETLRRDATSGNEELVDRLEMVADHILVKIRPDATEDDLVALNQQYGATIRRKLLVPGTYLVELQDYDLDAVARAVEAYSQAAETVAYSEPDYIVHVLQTLPDDTRLSELWGMHNTGQTGGTPDADIDAPEAWDIATGSSSILVGVIDTGVDDTHPDLVSNMWNNPGETGLDGGGLDRRTNGIDDDGNGFIDDYRGWDFVNNDNDPYDDHRHGTHVSGTIGGVGNNGAGVVGVNWSVSIVGLKFLSGGGSGTTSDAIDAVIYGTLIDVRLTSNSWGGGGYSQGLFDAIEDANANGILFIAAAGNSSRNTDASPNYPSTYTNANLIAVAALDHNDNLASFSNYGATTVDLGAPGVNTLSTTPGNSYSVFSGTSMATPHVSGVAALAWGLNQSATHIQIRDVILNGTVAISALSGKTVTGGRLNAFNTAVLLGLQVIGSSPADGDLLFTQPADYVIDFSNPNDTGSVAAADFMVNGTTADTFTQTDADTLTFHFAATPVTNQGLQTMVMAEDSILRASDGIGLKAWSAGFRYDAIALAVTSIVPADGEAVLLPVTNLVLNFNEPYDPASVEAADLVLNQGAAAGVNVVDADTLEFVLIGVTHEGTLTSELPAGALTDLYGNPNVAFLSTNILDTETNAFPAALRPLDPFGSLIYDGSADATLAPPGDTDTYLFDVEAGQTLAVIFHPDANLRGALELRNPSLGLEANATAGASGEDIVLPEVSPTQAGTYSLDVRDLAGASGAYTLRALLNTLLEDEDHGGPTNNTLATAQDINGSFIDLPGGILRGAVLGSLPLAGNIPVISEGFESGVLGPAWSSVSTAGGRTRLLGTYGTASGSYALMMDRDQVDSDFELNEAVWTLDLSSITAPSLSFWHAEWTDEQHPFGGDFVGSVNADGIAISDDGVNWHPIWSAANQSTGVWQQYSIDLVAAAAAGGMSLGPSFRIKFQQYDDFWLTSDGRGWDNVAITIPGAIEDWYSFDLESGESANVLLKSLADGDVSMALYNADGVLQADGVGATGNVTDRIEGYAVPTAGTYYVRVQGIGLDYTLTVVRDAAFSLEPNNTLPTAQDANTVGQVLGGVNVADPFDHYSIDVLSGDALVFTTVTPGDAPGEFRNGLDPALELYGPIGALIAADDNGAPDGRNALLSHTATNAGAYKVRVLASAGDGEYLLRYNQLGISIPSSAAEGDGVLTGAGVLTISAPRTNDLTVNLLSSDLSEATVPATAVITAGQLTAAFDLTVIDDAIFDGSQVATISASAAGFGNGVAAITVHDSESAALAVMLPASATEGDGILAGLSSVSMSSIAGSDVTVTLSSSDTTEITVPPTLVIPSGQMSTTFNITVVDDNQIDGPQSPSVTAQVVNWTVGNAGMSILDNETTNLTLSLPAQVSEGNGLLYNAGSVSIAGVLPVNLAVSLASDDTTELAVPVTATIFAGQTSRSFNLTVVNDADFDGSQTATVTANAMGFVGDTGLVVVLDNEVDHFAFTNIASPQAVATPVGVTISPRDVNGLPITTFSGVVPLSGAGDGGPAMIVPDSTVFSGGDWVGEVTVNTVLSNVVLTVDDGLGHTGMSNPFDVLPGPLDHFEWNAIPSPQYTNFPVELTLLARDANNFPLPGFSGAVALSGWETSAEELDTIIGDLTSGLNSFGHYTLGYSITPSTNLYVTHVRHYSGVKVSIWRDTGELLAAQPVTSTRGTWVETPLTEPLALQKGSTYRVAYTTASGFWGRYYWRTALPPNFSHGSIDGGFFAVGDAFPDSPSSALWMVDLTYAFGDPTPVSISPVSTGPFVDGAWSGDVWISEAATNMFLRADDGAGHVSDSERFAVVLQPPLTVSLPESAVEGEVSPFGTLASVSLPRAASFDLVVDLISDDLSEASAPSNVAIFAGETGTVFSLTIIDDAILDGSQDVTILASAPGHVTGTNVFLVHDDESTTLTVSIPVSASETAGVLVAQGTITSAAVVDEDVTVALESDDTTEVTVPETAVIPAGQNTASFDVTIVDENFVDGDQTVTVSAGVTNWPSASDAILVVDDEDFNLVMTLYATNVVEGSGTWSYSGMIEMSGILESNIVVTLMSDDTTELTVPATRTILASNTFVYLTFTVVDDAEQDGSQAVVITADAPNFIGATGNVVVTDNDVHHLGWDPISSPQTQGEPFDVRVTAQTIDDVRVKTYSGSTAALSGTANSGPVVISPTVSAAFIQGIWNGQILINTLEANVVLTADDGLFLPGLSNPFDVNKPIISITPATLTNAVVFAGGITNRALTIGNTGGADLNFTVLSNGPPPDYVTKHVIESAFGAVQSAYPVDMDGDGDVDVVGAADGDNEIAWWENDGSQVFTRHVVAAEFDKASDVHAADVDGDTDIDVVGASRDLGEIAWFENDGSENFTKHVVDDQMSEASSVYAIDINGDGDMDLLGAAIDQQQVAWFENDGLENFTKRIVDAALEDAIDAYPVDLDQDGDVDILAAGLNADVVVWYENNGSENFFKDWIDAGGQAPRSVHAGDMDGDGDLDVVGALSGDNAIVWWENDPYGDWYQYDIDTSLLGASSVYADDLDDDGDMDVLAAAGVANRIVWYENNGAGEYDTAFTQHIVGVNFRDARSAVSVDMDGNERKDILAVAAFDNDIAWWENDQAPPPVRAGTLTNQTVGVWTNLQTSSLQDRGNLYSVTSAAVLVNVEAYLDLPVATPLSFFIYESPEQTGTYTRIANDLLGSAGPGETWYSSGEVFVPMAPGYFYYIGVSWPGSATHGHGGTAPVSMPFGLLGSGVPGTQAGYPPGASVSLAPGGVAPYRQRLSFARSLSGAPVWAWPGTDTVVPGTNLPLHIIFDGQHLLPGQTVERTLFLGSDDFDARTNVIPVAVTALLGVPRIIGSAPYTFGTSNSIAWTTLPGGDLYTAEQALEPTFLVATNTGGLATNEHVFSGLTLGATYYYRVNATANPGPGQLVGPWSDWVATRQISLGGDEDGDTLPNDWEDRYGLDPLTHAGSNDLDGDGLSDVGEHIADTAPDDGNSFFEIEGAAVMSPVEVFFDSSTGRLYTLQYTLDLVTGTWTDVDGQIRVQGNGALRSLSDTNAPAGAGFYRVDVERPE